MLAIEITFKIMILIFYTPQLRFRSVIQTAFVVVGINAHILSYVLILMSLLNAILECGALILRDFGRLLRVF